MEGLEAILATVDKKEALDAVMATVATRKDAEEIREKLGELADIAWLSTVSVMREKPYMESKGQPADASSPAEARFNHHLELLNIYMRAAGENVSSLNADELVSRFGVLIETRKNTLPESAHTFLQFYQILYTQLKTYQPSYLMFLFYLNLADICFSIVSVMESTVYQTPAAS